MDEQHRPDRVGREDLHDRHPAGLFAGVDAGGDAKGLLPRLPQRPAARHREARAVGLAPRLVVHVEPRA
jgi:hypothetical protein